VKILIFIVPYNGSLAQGEKFTEKSETTNEEQVQGDKERDEATDASNIT
jgi:hypothetical protein